ncbi:hypothetical protein SAMN05444143_101267 [Flavobacterium succinicans]|uniref:Uncharacterized protein n=1 Tax=Flavobacterium succinicans TaxID=29536 RepID=A0A1I4RA63_9FLAO|nr:hypothetical protein [Flavobacterium succinicans]SFM49089.1 hypothetical protein SAMN05444143_101267 [Flavobacterium succinicans]
MELFFQTKEESNKKQIDDFLKLSKCERFYSFLRLMEKMQEFPIKKKVKKSTNFILNKKEHVS